MEQKKLIEALIDIYERAEEADEAMQYHWPELESVVNASILNSLKTVARSIDLIESIVIASLGGTSRVMELLDAREREEDS